MIVAEQKLVLNPTEVQAAQGIKFPARQLKLLPDSDGYHVFVLFPTNYERDVWRQRIEDAVRTVLARQRPEKCEACGHKTKKLDNVGTGDFPYWMCEKCQQERPGEPSRMADRRRH